MVDAPWLSPGEQLWGIFYFWSLVIGHWSLVIGHWALVLSVAEVLGIAPSSSLSPFPCPPSLTHFSFLPLLPAPCSPASLLPVAALVLGEETTSGKERLAM